jgi:cytoskeleton protein RodZ
MTKVTRLTVDDGTANRARRTTVQELGAPPLTSLETVGQELRAARLQRGEDLAAVSRALKIRKDHLDAIEEDRLDALPGRTYAIGFVRAYAQHVGFDPKATVERYKTEIAGRSEPENVSITVIDDEYRPMPRGWKIVAGVIVALMIYGLYYVIASTGSSQPSTPAPPPLNPAPVTHRAPAPQPAASAPTSAAAASTANDPLPPGVIYGQMHSNARVVLRVHKPTHILIEGPDRKVFINRDLQRGDSYKVPNVTGATLSTPNPNNVEIDLDGQSMGYASKDATLADRLSLDPNAITDRVKGAAPR